MRQPYTQLGPSQSPQDMHDPYRPATPGYTRQPSPAPPPASAPMGYYPPATTSPPPMGYPPPPPQSFTQAGHVVQAGYSHGQQGYSDAMYPPHPAPHPPQAPGLVHHSSSQPLYDPGYPPPSHVPTYDHFAPTPGPPITTQQPEGGIYLPDPRMTSPPPLMQHQSSDAFLYADGQVQGMYDTPPRGYSPYPGQGMPGGYTMTMTHHPQGDDLADEPLLPGDTSRYGNPFDAGADEGDLADGGAKAGAVGEDEPVTLRYGAAPEGRMIRRLKTTKRVPLFRGNLVLECPVPTALLELCPIEHRKEQEFALMRYTAVTCGPDDFAQERYTLRQKQLYEPTRKTEIFIVITMYNEDEVLFARTMRGVMANIAHLNNERSRSTVWGDDGWKKVVVCIVVDGRKVFNPRTRAMLAALGVYQEGIAKNMVGGKAVEAHVYEYTTQLTIDKNHQVVPAKKWAPVQMILCVKEKNAKKINSHRWFFNAFGPILQPNVCVLLDVGTDPASTSIYHLWKTFDLKPNCGGACGEIVALKGLYWRNLFNPLVAAQNFEYKMSNILDKPLESAFGWITVLPGAFSAYRYKALENDAHGEGPLKQYFLGEHMHGADAGIFTANMYLAEDRILCWELVSKRGSRWTLHYVKSARAVTDVPELVSQRRRWLNGSFFAAIHSIVHFGYLYRSKHGFWRKFFLHIELIYQTYNMIFTWFSLGNYYIAFYILTKSLQDYVSWTKYINIPLAYIYLALLVMCFLLSMGNRPQGSVAGYTAAMVGFAFITVYMVASAIYLAVVGIKAAVEDGNIDVADYNNADQTFRNIVLSLIATYGIYILASLLALDPWHMLTSFIQYLLLAPSYINVFNVYAFSNVHDVSWGTKGSDKVDMDLGAAGGGKNAKAGEVDVAVPTEEKDINALYAAELQRLAQPAPPEVKTKSAAQKQEDYYKASRWFFPAGLWLMLAQTFRTNTLLIWVVSNAGLAAGILNATIKVKSKTLSAVYMGFILYSVAALAAIRFLGSTWYLTLRLFQRE
ncbi:hypothetical protein NliqN6_2791 [Naganishia liquefaciens]|uniref:chitin synthase n=1 Tax=Naganishia liquefaciens TaxID=104408 RepID=A0A8H3TUH3_9TREE|nr:hypothetical protein NliqN6_2791 [Naganishia liquefaciens]